MTDILRPYGSIEISTHNKEIMKTCARNETSIFIRCDHTHCVNLAYLSSNHDEENHHEYRKISLSAVFVAVTTCNKLFFLSVRVMTQYLTKYI